MSKVHPLTGIICSTSMNSKVPAHTQEHSQIFSNLHQQVKIIITQARGGTVIPITGMNYNIYMVCFICGWQTDGSVAF